MLLPAVTAFKAVFCIAVFLEPIVELGRAVLEGKKPAVR
jgi:hypothetical protein